MTGMDPGLRRDGVFEKPGAAPAGVRIASTDAAKARRVEAPIAEGGVNRGPAYGITAIALISIR